VFLIYSCHNINAYGVSRSIMNNHLQDTFNQLPEEMFSIVQATTTGIGARLGRLVLPGCKVIDTPHYLASTSRGVVPHITPDNFVRFTPINGVYVALEDCKSYPALPISRVSLADSDAYRKVSHRKLSSKSPSHISISTSRWFIATTTFHRSS